MESAGDISCPFCDYAVGDEYDILYHIERTHAENGTSPFIAVDETHASPTLPSSTTASEEGGQPDGNNDLSMLHLPAGPALPESTASTTSPSASLHLHHSYPTADYVQCPRKCGELILFQEVASHMDLHFAENMALEDASWYPESTTTFDGLFGLSSPQAMPSFSTQVSHHLRNLDQHDTAHQSDYARSAPRYGGFILPGQSEIDYSVQKLGKAELGPHAYEKQMPDYMHKILKKDGQVKKSSMLSLKGSSMKRNQIVNHTNELIPTLARLLKQDSKVERAILCSPHIRHIGKLPREGSFCGYRNLQMLISHLCDAERPGREKFHNKVPSVLELQDMIEDIWDRGVYVNARSETGGIRNTRKYIGTPEAQTLFIGLELPCQARGIGPVGKNSALDHLLLVIGDYFINGSSETADGDVEITDLPPIYLQHAGHSMTIVGFEIRGDNKVNLLVFDPVFRTAPAMERYLINGATGKLSEGEVAHLLQPYRRGERHLGFLKAFEIFLMTDCHDLDSLGSFEDVDCKP